MEEESEDDNSIAQMFAEAEEQLDREIHEFDETVQQDEGGVDENDEVHSQDRSESNSDTNDSPSETDDSEPSTYRSGRPRRAAAGRGINRLVMDPKGKGYLSSKHKQFMMKAKLKRTKKKVILTMIKRSMFSDNNTMHQTAVGIVFQQMKTTKGEFEQVSAKLGIKRFGEEAVAAMIKEFSQLYKGDFPGNP